MPSIGINVVSRIAQSVPKHPSLPVSGAHSKKASVLGRMAGRVGDPVKSCSSFEKEIKEPGIQIAAFCSGQGQNFPQSHKGG